MNPVYWISEPPMRCDIRKELITDTFIDGRTSHGPWACMCPRCHAEEGMGLGTGRGQKYQKQEDGRWLKVEG